MSGLHLSLTSSHTQSDTKETASSIKKLNTWSTPFVFNNDCIKKIMEFCNVHQIFRLGCVNRHCNHIVSNTYSNLSFCLQTIHSDFTDSGSFTTLVESTDNEEYRDWYDNLKRDIVSNIDLRFLKYDIRPTIGEDQDILIKKGINSLEVVDRRDGKCLIDLIPPNGNTKKIIRAFRITEKEYISISLQGEIHIYNIKNLIKDTLPITSSFTYQTSFDISITKVFLIEDKLYLLSQKTEDKNLILISYSIKEKNFSIFCEKSSRGNPVVNCIANKTHLFVIFQYAIACYDNQNNLVWEIEDAHSNEKSLLEVNNKFLLITSYPVIEIFRGFSRHNAYFKVIDIIKRESKTLKSKKLLFKDCPPFDYINFFGDYLISTNKNERSALIQLWNPNNGKLIITVYKMFNFCNQGFFILKDNKGIISFSETDVPLKQLSIEQRRDFKITPDFQKKFLKYEFFLLKPPVIPKK